MDNVLHLLGIARKAGRVEVGEEPVGASARARQARLILVASDAADNSARRAAHFAQAGKAPWFRVPYTKGELGGTVGRASCAGYTSPAGRRRRSGHAGPRRDGSGR